MVAQDVIWITIENLSYFSLRLYDWFQISEDYHNIFCISFHQYIFLKALGEISHWNNTILDFISIFSYVRYWEITHLGRLFLDFKYVYVTTDVNLIWSEGIIIIASKTFFLETLVYKPWWEWVSNSPTCYCHWIVLWSEANFTQKLYKFRTKYIHVGK